MQVGGNEVAIWFYKHLEAFEIEYKFFDSCIQWCILEYVHQLLKYLSRTESTPCTLNLKEQEGNSISLTLRIEKAFYTHFNEKWVSVAQSFTITVFISYMPQF